MIISDTAAGTKEGRELTEGGYGPGADNWVWLKSGANEGNLVKSGAQVPCIPHQHAIFLVVLMLIYLLDLKLKSSM